MTNTIIDYEKLIYFIFVELLGKFQTILSKPSAGDNHTGFLVNLASLKTLTVDHTSLTSHRVELIKISYVRT